MVSVLTATVLATDLRARVLPKPSMARVVLKLRVVQKPSTARAVLKARVMTVRVLKPRMARKAASLPTPIRIRTTNCRRVSSSSKTFLVLQELTLPPLRHDPVGKA
jgi:hypothetical protein